MTTTIQGTATLYGIAHCDKVRKARLWLKQADVDHDFWDYKKAGVDTVFLDHLADLFGWDFILNRAGTTFRKLPENVKDTLDRQRALSLMQEHCSVIKRPILRLGTRTLIGFTAEKYAEFFNHVSPKSDG